MKRLLPAAAIPLLAIVLAVPGVVSCATDTVNGSDQVSAVASEPRFRSYDEAIRYIRSHYEGESFDTRRSSWITSAEYYPAKGRGYMIIGMRGKPYLYAGVPWKVWNGFKNAPSLGRYYHQNIKGRYRFNL